jgi:hypothetical protein
MYATVPNELQAARGSPPLTNGLIFPHDGVTPEVEQHKGRQAFSHLPRELRRQAAHFDSGSEVPARRRSDLRALEPVW